MLLAAAGLFSFGFGLVGALLSLKRKTQATVIFASNLPILTNIAGVKTSLDMYGLANPWLILIGSLALSIISALLICNADEVFK
jgi:hypothetical protein